MPSRMDFKYSFPSAVRPLARWTGTSLITITLLDKVSRAHIINRAGRDFEWKSFSGMEDIGPSVLANRASRPGRQGKNATTTVIEE